MSTHYQTRLVLPLLCSLAGCIESHWRGGADDASLDIIDFESHLEGISADSRGMNTDGAPDVTRLPDTVVALDALQDAVEAAPDSSVTGEDSAATGEDSAATGEDSAVTVPDSAATVPDSAATGEDSAATVPDSAVTVPDSAVTVPDSAATVPDSAVTVPDSAVTVPDSGPLADDYCADQPDLTPCGTDLAAPFEVCLAGRCRPPACADRSCNPAGPGHSASAETFNASDPAENGDLVVIGRESGLWWQQRLTADPQYLWSEADDHCAALELAGKSDWRLPDCYEIDLLVDWDSSYPALDLSVQADDALPLWAWTSCYYDADKAWALNANRGDMRAQPNDTEGYAWCVRGPASPTFGPDSPRFGSEGPNDGILRDHATGLLWQRSDDGQERSWDEAVSRCRNLSLEGLTTWRLPDIDELWSIVDARRPGAPTLDPAFEMAAGGTWFWSATPLHDGQHEDDHGNRAWPVDFSVGRREPQKQKEDHRVRCVAFP